MFTRKFKVSGPAELENKNSRLKEEGRRKKAKG
jgi:hypothetical protein